MANQIGFLDCADQLESSDQKPELLLRWKQFIHGLNSQYHDRIKELLSCHESIFAAAEEVISRGKEAIGDIVLPSEGELAEEGLLRLKKNRTKLKVLESLSSLLLCPSLLFFFSLMVLLFKCLSFSCWLSCSLVMLPMYMCVVYCRKPKEH